MMRWRQPIESRLILNSATEGESGKEVKQNIACIAEHYQETLRLSWNCLSMCKPVEPLAVFAERDDDKYQFAE